MSDIREMTVGQAFDVVRDIYRSTLDRLRRLGRGVSDAATGPGAAEAGEKWKRRVTLAAVLTAGVACLYYMIPGMLVVFGAALAALTFFY
jgi:hypothetical protein